MSLLEADLPNLGPVRARVSGCLPEVAVELMPGPSKRGGLRTVVPAGLVWMHVVAELPAGRREKSGRSICTRRLESGRRLINLFSYTEIIMHNNICKFDMSSF